MKSGKVQEEGAYQMKHDKLIYYLLTTVAILNVALSIYLLVNQQNAIKERRAITCILLILPEDRTDNSIKGCY